jgi:hypothetical protein
MKNWRSEGLYAKTQKITAATPAQEMLGLARNASSRTEGHSKSLCHKSFYQVLVVTRRRQLRSWQALFEKLHISVCQRAWQTHLQSDEVPQRVLSHFVALIPLGKEHIWLMRLSRY